MFSIRKAEDRDVLVIHDIIREAAATLARPEFFVADDEESLRRHIREEGFILTARRGAEGVGFLMVDVPGLSEKNLGRDLGWPEADLLSVAHIESVCVRPAYRGRGLQKRLMAAAEERLEHRGFRHYLATVHPDNTPSLASFIALGYRIAATGEKYGGLPRHILVKCSSAWQ